MSRRILSILLLLSLVLTLAAGCKPAQGEEFGVTDTVVEEGTSDTPRPEQTPDQKEEPDQAPDQTDEPEQTPSDQEPTEQEPTDQEPLDQEPTEQEPEEQEPEEDPDFVPQDPDEGPPPEESLPPVEKESSGTPITFLSQNIIHAGYSYGEKGDGTGNNLYNRLRRFKALVMEQDPDVIFVNEARRGTLDFLEKDAYFAKNYLIHITDRVGGGDSFGGGLIHAMNKWPGDCQAIIEYAVAASCLKQTIEYDFNQASEKEVLALAGGNASGRVQR